MIPPQTACVRPFGQSFCRGCAAPKGSPWNQGGARSARAVREAARSKPFEAPKYRASEAQAGTKTPMKQGVPQASLRAAEAAKRLEPRGAHEARALWAKQRGVSPMRQGEPQASLRAMRNDHAELWTRSEAKSAGAEHRAAKGGTVRRRGTTMLN